MGNIWADMGIPHAPVVPRTILGWLLHEMEMQSPPAPQVELGLLPPTGME